MASNFVPSKKYSFRFTKPASDNSSKIPANILSVVPRKRELRKRLMVLKSGVHPMREIEQATKQLRQADVNLRGLIFNDIQAASRQYGAGRYHYQYSYKED